MILSSLKSGKKSQQRSQSLLSFADQPTVQPAAQLSRTADEQQHNLVARRLAAAGCNLNDVTEEKNLMFLRLYVSILVERRNRCDFKSEILPCSNFRSLFFRPSQHRVANQPSCSCQMRTASTLTFEFQPRTVREDKDERLPCVFDTVKKGCRKVEKDVFVPFLTDQLWKEFRGTWRLRGSA